MAEWFRERAAIIIALLASTHLISVALTTITPASLYLRDLVGFIIISYALGASLRLLLREQLGQKWLPKTFTIEGMSLDLLLSLILNIILTYMLVINYIFTDNNLSLLIDLTVLGLNSLHLFKRTQESVADYLEEKKHSWNYYLPPLIILVASTYFGVVFRSYTPYPTMSGWDLNSALAYISWIRQNNGFSYFLIPSFPAGNTPYAASFFFLVSSYSAFLGLEPLKIFWLSIIPTIFLYMFLTYLIALRFSNNIPLSLTSSFAVFCASITVAEVVRNPLYLTPDMVAQLIFLLIFVFNLYHKSSTYGKTAINIVLAGFLLLFNFYTFFVVFPFLVYYIIGKNKIPFIGDGISAFHKCLLAIIIVFSSATVLSPFLPLGIASFFSTEIFPPLLKIEVIAMLYPWFFILLSIAGFFTFLKLKIDKVNGLTIFDLFLYSLTGLVLYFFPAWVTYRIEFYFRTFLAVFISGIGILLNQKVRTSTTLTSLTNPHKEGIKLIAGFAILLLLITLTLPIFMDYKPYARYSQDEYDAATWLKANSPSNAYLVTDPSSGFVFRSLTLRNASSYFVLPDGRMPTDYSTINPEIVTLTHTFFSNPTITTWTDLSATISSREYVLITSRTALWSRSSQGTVINAPIAGIDASKLTNALLEQGYHILYNNKSVEILTYNP